MSPLPRPILFVDHATGLGGAEHSLLMLLEHLDRARFTPHLVCPKGKLADAARVIAGEPVAIQLRYLQTLVEVATEHNSTTIFPLPMDLIRPFLGAVSDDGEG